MTHAVTHEPQENPRPAPPDAENPAIIDAEKTFRIIAISAVLFVLAGLFVVLRTRLG
jgi:hypothetical protein